MRWTIGDGRYGGISTIGRYSIAIGDGATGPYSEQCHVLTTCAHQDEGGVKKASARRACRHLRIGVGPRRLPSACSEILYKRASTASIYYGTHSMLIDYGPYSAQCRTLTAYTHQVVGAAGVERICSTHQWPTKKKSTREQWRQSVGRQSSSSGNSAAQLYAMPR